MKAVLSLAIAFAMIIASNADFDISQLPEEDQEWFNNIHQTCVDESEVDEGAIDKANEGEFDDDNQQFKKYAECIMSKAGALDEDNNIHYESIAEHAPEEYHDILENMFGQCSHIEDEDRDQLAYDVFKCTYEVDPEHYFII